MSPELDKIAGQLKDNVSVAPTTVRTFLSWFGAQRRGYWIVRDIRRALKEADLVTLPDFESAWIDAFIRFKKIDDADETTNGTDATTEAPSVKPIEVIKSDEWNWLGKEASFRVSKLEAANQRVISANPDSTLAEVITWMMASGFSQIPIISGERTVKGVVSWQSIGQKLALRKAGEYARDFMVGHHEIRWDTSIFDVIPIVSAYDYVLVRGPQEQISGIITASDLNLQFRSLSEPFLLLSEIENLIRNMIGEKLSLDDLKDACDPGSSDRKVESIADLTFGEYLRLLQNPDRWLQLRMLIDRAIFCKKLDRVREIRNDVMHFDPDGITSSDVDELRDFASFMKRLEKLHSSSR